MYAYRALVKRIVDSTHIEIEIDFGFRLYLPRVIEHEAGDNWARLGWPVFIRIDADSDGSWTAALNRDPVGQYSPPLWSYEAELVRVVDGDTFDARVRFATGLEIEERFRLAGVYANELGDKDGYLAKDYVTDRFDRVGGRMHMVTTHRGKWRRWIATVYLPDSETTLNADMVASGVARARRRRDSASRTHRRVDLRLASPLYDVLTDRAKAVSLRPNELACNIVQDSLENPQ